MKLFSLLIYTFSAVNFPLSTLVILHKFWCYIFIFIQFSLFFYFTWNFLLGSCGLCRQVCIVFFTSVGRCSCCCPIIGSSLMPLWLENTVWFQFFYRLEILFMAKVWSIGICWWALEKIYIFLLYRILLVDLCCYNKVP